MNTISCRNLRIIALCLFSLFFLMILSACRKTTSEDTLGNDFQIYLTEYITILEKEKDQSEPFNVLQDADYIITDKEILSYDWDKQLIIVDDTVQETYINDFDFLLPPMAFAIVWNGEVVARGEVTDIGSPMIVSYPVLHVLEPVANPEYSTRRLLSSYNPAYASVEDFTILLRSEKKSAVSLEKDVTELIFEDSVASEIKKHFRQTGRLVK